MSLLGRDVGEIEALVTDRYLDTLLAGRDLSAAWVAPGRAGSVAVLDEAVRTASRRLAGDLPRFHPSFRFEERLAVRLAEAAASMRLPLAAGGERDVAIPLPIRTLAPDPLTSLGDEAAAADPRPYLVRGAVAASALSLAGAAWIAWRRHSGSPMARAVRAAHQARG